jgi:hypothetical protein
MCELTPRRELDGVRQQVPDGLLQALTIAVDAAAAFVDDRLDPDPLGLGRRLDAGARRGNHRPDIEQLDLQTQLA